MIQIFIIHDMQNPVEDFASPDQTQDFASDLRKQTGLASVRAVGNPCPIEAHPGLANEEVQQHSVICDGVLLTSKTHTGVLKQGMGRRVFFFFFALLLKCTVLSVVSLQAHLSCLSTHTAALSLCSSHATRFRQNRLQKKNAVNYE